MGVFDLFKTKPNVEEMKATGDIEGLIKLLGYERDKAVRKRAAETLAEIGETAVDALIQALGDKKRSIRHRAAKILGKIGGTRAIEPLVETLKREVQERSETEGWFYDDVGSIPPYDLSAPEALVMMGEPAIDALIKALQDKNSLVREEIARILGEIGDQRAVEPLSYALKDESADVRKRAGRALEKMKKQ